MTKRKKTVSKTGPIWHQSAEEATLAKKPRYNGFAVGHGIQGDVKYNRAKEKRAWKKQLRKEGASNGSLHCLWAYFPAGFLKRIMQSCLCDGCTSQRACLPPHSSQA